jgi:RHS repeat-associated protein
LLITDIKYNHLQLPYEITFSNGNNIKWVYDAEGNKLRKVTKTGATTTTTDYCGGIEYKNNVMNAIYHSEGRLTAGAGIAPFSQPRYEYTLTDHLGNGRVYYTDLNNDGIGTMADLLQDNHYYPFGLNHTDPRRNTGGVGVNLYQYNGKELVEDNGLGWNHYGARCYDPATGRMSVVDQRAEKYRSFGAYNYVLGNPIRLIDPTGMESRHCPTCPQNKTWQDVNESPNTYVYDEKSKTATQEGANLPAAEAADESNSSASPEGQSGSSGGSGILSEVWNSATARFIVPDYFTFGIGIQASSGVSAGFETALTLTVRGKDPGLYFNYTHSAGTTGSVDFDLSVSRGSGRYVRSDIRDFSSSDLGGDQLSMGASVGVLKRGYFGIDFGGSVDIGLDGSTPTTIGTKSSASIGPGIATPFETFSSFGRGSKPIPVFKF